MTQDVAWRKIEEARLDRNRKFYYQLFQERYGGEDIFKREGVCPHYGDCAGVGNGYWYDLQCSDPKQTTCPTYCRKNGDLGEVCTNQGF